MKYHVDFTWIWNSTLFPAANDKKPTKISLGPKSKIAKTSSEPETKPTDDEDLKKEAKEKGPKIVLEKVEKSSDNEVKKFIEGPENSPGDQQVFKNPFHNKSGPQKRRLTDTDKKVVPNKASKKPRQEDDDSTTDDDNQVRSFAQQRRKTRNILPPEKYFVKSIL